MGDEYIYPPSAAKSGPQGLPDERLARGIERNAAHWDEAVRSSPLNRLRYYDALLARTAFSGNAGERERIKIRVGELIREIGAPDVLTDPDVVGLVRELFGEKGVTRLKDRARTSA
jgi:RNase P protein component